MAELNAVDQRVLDVLSGADRIRALLKDAGFPTSAAFARQHGFREQEVSFCVNGDRRYPEIRDALAGAVGVARSEVDALIDGVPAARAS